MACLVNQTLLRDFCSKEIADVVSDYKRPIREPCVILNPASGGGKTRRENSIL